MDPKMYFAAMKGSMEDGDFSLVDHLKREEENGYQVTPKGNTILHVAALFGQRGFVGEVLKITPALLCYKNKKNETALHIAANVGLSEVVSELLSSGGVETLVRMTDDIGDTALHKAVRGGHIDIVRMLVKLLLDPEHDFPANKAGETALYLAAESGFHDALIEILNVCKEPTYVAGPSNRTPLHAAIIQEHTECARSLWQWNKPLCEASDKWGWNSLHYAVKQGSTEIVSDMLGWKKSLAYLPAGSENDVLMKFELLSHCPDCWEMRNSNGQNALHVALLNCHKTFFYAFLESGIWDSLVDEADNEGNTPLHLLAASGNHVPRLILDHPRAKKMTFNKQNQTPLDIALSRTWTIKKEKLVGDLCSINGRLGQRDFKVKRKTETIGNIQQMRKKEDADDKAKRDKTEIEKIMKAAQIQVVVATLLMTVTFAAGFTLPGGLYNDDSPNKGMAILLRKAAFRAFVISDVLAFSFSAGAIFIYFFMADSDVDDDEDFKRDWFKVLRSYYYIAETRNFCDTLGYPHIMNPRMYIAAWEGNMEDGDFSLVDHLKREEENGYQVTPKGNTILHVAAHFGQRGFVGEVLKITPALLCYKNKKNETALHVAANLGQSEVVSELLSIEGKETLVRMTDDIGDTALHKAVRSGHIDIVRMLVKLLLDPEHDFPANKAEEAPLYLAAESGFHDALIEILNVCKEPTYVAGPSNRTPLHAAVIQEHMECVRSLWQWNKPLCEEVDRWGWNSLHYAVKQGLKEIISDMLGWKKSLAYLPAGSENDWTTAFHIAASEGDVLMIYELLNHCPDCWEMLNSNGQNALHVALLNGHEMFVYVFYECGFWNSLVDEADNEGNTPLHLLAASGDNVPLIMVLLDHPIAKKMAFNKQNQTPLDIALSRTWTTKKVLLLVRDGFPSLLWTDSVRQFFKN